MAGELQLLGRIEDFTFSLEVRLHSTRAIDRRRPDRHAEPQARLGRV
jgi:hypothetical protein